MPFNGSGVFQRVRNWVADATAGIKIRADYHDAEDDGFAQGLTNCITKDGQTIVTQNIPFNSKRITGLQDPVNDQDAATKKYADVAFKTGGKMTGDLEVEKDGPTFTLDDTDDAGNSIIGQHKGKNRWVMHLGNADAETGTGDAGSNFDLIRYADDGTTLLGTPMKINRATGNTISEGLTVNGELVAAQNYIRFTTSGTGGYINWTGGTNYSAGGNTLWHSGNFTPSSYQPALGFTPVQQGGGAGQVTNKIYIGWSGAGLKAQVDATDLGSFVFGGTGVVFNGRLAIASDVLIVNAPQNVMYEPYLGACVTGWQWVSGGYPILTVLRHRWVQLYTTGWFTVGTA